VSRGVLAVVFRHSWKTYQVDCNQVNFQFWAGTKQYYTVCINFSLLNKFTDLFVYEEASNTQWYFFIRHKKKFLDL